MNNRKPQADALDRFFDQLTHDVQAEIPDELDQDMAQFGIELVQALRVPPLDAVQQERIWMATRFRSDHPSSNKMNIAHMDMAAIGNRRNLARSGWNGRALGLIAAVLIAVFVGILTTLPLDDILPGGEGGAYGTSITPTPPPETPPNQPAVESAVEEVYVGQGKADQVLWSPDGTTLALVGAEHAWLYPANNLRAEPEQITANIRIAQYLANGNLAALVVNPEDNSTQYVNLSTGETIILVPGLDGTQVIMPTLSRDGHYLAASTFAGEVIVWDTASGDIVARLFINVNTPAMALAFSPDGTWLAAGPNDFAVRLWHTPDGNWSAVDGQEPTVLVSSLRSEKNIPHLVFDAGGEHLAVAIGDDVEVWNVAQQKVISTLETDDLLQPEGQNGAGQITGLDISYDGQSVLTSGPIMRLWDVSTGMAFEQSTLGQVLSAVFSPDGNRFATLGQDGYLHIWFTATSINQAARRLVPITSENIDRLIQIGMIGRGEVSTLAWSPDGRTLAASGYIGVWLYDAANLEAEPRLLPSEVPLSAVAFAPDGTLYSVNFDYVLQRWDVARGTSTVVAKGLPNPYNPRLALHPDGTLAAVGGGDGMIDVYELDNGTLRGTLSANPNTPIDHVAWSPDGTRLGATSDDGAGRVWYDPTGMWQTFPANPPVVVLASTAAEMTPQIAFNPDGATFVTVGSSGTVVWDSNTGAQIKTIGGSPRYGSSGIAYSPNGAQIVTASPDVRLWDIVTNTSVTLTTPRNLTFGFLMSVVAFHPDGEQVAVLGNTGELAVWNINTGVLDAFVPSLGYIQSADASDDGSQIALLSGSGTVMLWDVAAGQIIARLSPEDYLNDPMATNYSSSIALSADARYVAFGGALDTVRLWDTANGTVRHLVFESPLTRESLYPPQLYALSFSHDEQHLAAGGAEGILAVWDTTTGAHITTLQASAIEPSNSTVFSLSWSPDDTILAAGNGDMGNPQAADFSVRLWNITSGETLTVLEGHTDRVTQVQFSPDGSRLLSVSYGDLRIWDVQDGTPIASVTARTGALLSNDILIAVADEGTPSLYDVSTGNALATIPAMPSESLLIASTDGRVVITIGRAGVVRVWGVPEID